MRCAVCKARQLRRLGVYLVPLSAFVHTCMDLPGMPGISDQDGLLTVPGTSLGRDFSFFSGFISSFVGSVPAHSMHFVSLLSRKRPLVRLRAIGNIFQHWNLLFLFSVIGIPPSHPRLLYFCSIVRHLGEMTYHNIRLQEHTSSLYDTPTSISRANPSFYFSCRMPPR